MTAQREPLKLPGPLSARLIAVAMTCIFSGLGAAHFVTEYAPDRWTKHGYTGPLEGSTAEAFGLSMFCFGLLPLMLAAPSRRSAMGIAAVAVTGGLASLFLSTLL